MDASPCILAATDFSPAADCAVHRAAMAARQLGATLHVLHVIYPLNLYPGQNIDATALDHTARDGAVFRLDRLARGLAEQYRIRTHAAWRFGLAHTQIADYGREVAAELVVTGARGENSIRRRYLGSTPMRLLRVRSGPLLVVRRPHWRYGRVLAAVDFSTDSNLAVGWARRLAGDAPLDILHVLEPEFDRRLPLPARQAANVDIRRIAAGLMDALLENLPGENVGHIETGYVPTRVLELAQRWRSDLVVVGRHGHGGLEAFLLGSVSKDVVQSAECDVLVTGA